MVPSSTGLLPNSGVLLTPDVMALVAPPSNTGGIVGGWREHSNSLAVASLTGGLGSLSSHHHSNNNNNNPTSPTDHHQTNHHSHHHSSSNSNHSNSSNNNNSHQHNSHHHHHNSSNNDNNGSSSVLNGLSSIGQTTQPPQPSSSASSAASPNSASVKAENIECVVCGDKSSGKHVSFTLYYMTKIRRTYCFHLLTMICFVFTVWTVHL